MMGFDSTINAQQNIYQCSFPLNMTPINDPKLHSWLLYNLPDAALTPWLQCVCEDVFYKKHRPRSRDGEYFCGEECYPSIINLFRHNTEG